MATTCMRTSNIHPQRITPIHPEELMHRNMRYVQIPSPTLRLHGLWLTANDIIGGRLGNRGLSCQKLVEINPISSSTHAYTGLRRSCNSHISIDRPPRKEIKLWPSVYPTRSSANAHCTTPITTVRRTIATFPSTREEDILTRRTI